MEPVEANRARVQPGCNAYRMDGGSPDMRIVAGLGTCNCCDYVTFDGTGRMVLIEETQLLRQIDNLRRECRDSSLSPDEVTKRILRGVKHENRLKVYGSLLVLCRLARRLTDEAEIQALAGQTDFWLVVSDTLSGDQARALDYIRGALLGDLRSVLAGAVVGDVQIVMASELGRRLPSHPSLQPA